MFSITKERVFVVALIAYMLRSWGGIAASRRCGGVRVGHLLVACRSAAADLKRQQSRWLCPGDARLIVG